MTHHSNLVEKVAEKVLQSPEVKKALSNLMTNFHHPATMKVTKSVKLSVQMSELVEDRAQISGVTVSDWIRRAIASELRRNDGQA
jgi:uncharacterized protein with von Willebrand factor type A (vWA) domain